MNSDHLNYSTLSKTHLDRAKHMHGPEDCMNNCDERCLRHWTMCFKSLSYKCQVPRENQINRSIPKEAIVVRRKNCNANFRFMLSLPLFRWILQVLIFYSSLLYYALYFLCSYFHFSLLCSTRANIGLYSYGIF